MSRFEAAQRDRLGGQHGARPKEVSCNHLLTAPRARNSMDDGLTTLTDSLWSTQPHRAMIEKLASSHQLRS